MNEYEEALDDIDNMRYLVNEAARTKLNRFQIDSMEARLNYLESFIKKYIKNKKLVKV
jgi:ppGpp synthetase/RelA/SpoT-type nucleotidyltranferase